MNGTHSIDPTWREDFVVALRMRDVEGAEIADQLKTVEVHCAESRESAQEAFGDARAYAAAVTGRPGDAGVVDLLPTAALSFIGGTMLVRGAVALARGVSVDVTVGTLVAAAILVVASLAVVRLMTAGRPRFAVLWGGSVTVAVVVAVAVLADVAETPLLVSVPAWAALLAAVAVLAVVAIGLARGARRQRVLDPLTGRSML